MIKLYSKEKEMNHKIQTNGDITEKRHQGYEQEMI